jgi:hypothetical protein
MMKDLVTTIVKAIVDYPNAVEVKEVDGERTTVIELRVAKEDVGKVIGKPAVRLACSPVRALQSLQQTHTDSASSDEYARAGLVSAQNQRS